MVVRMRHTRAHSANRRSHHKAPENALVKDKDTGVVHIRHRVSLETGMYKGRKVIKTKAEKLATRKIAANKRKK